MPISEYLKLTQGYNNLLLEFARIELSPNDSHKKVFIPLYRMENELANLTGYDRRLDNYTLCLQEEPDDVYSLVVADSSLKSDSAEVQIEGFKEYLKYWEDKPANSLILKTRWAKTIKELNLAQYINVYSSYFDIIKSSSIEGSKLSETWAQTSDRWEKLNVILGEGNSIIEAIKNHFGEPTAKVKDVIANWSKFDEFKKWLIWLWCKLEPEPIDGYLGNIMKLFDVSYAGFVEALINSIFQLLKDTGIEKLADERAKLLKIMGIVEKPISFWNLYDRIKEPYSKFICLTTESEKEKMEIVNLFGNAIKGEKQLDKWEEPLKRIYPELYYYSSFYPSDMDEVNKYFLSYIRNKLSDSVSSDHLQLVNEIANKQFWWNITPRNLKVEEKYNPSTILTWVDALNLEWLGLIDYLLRTKYNGIFYTIDIVTANMPTTTDINKDWFENRSFEEYRELDRFNHDNNVYSYPINIVKQINMVCEMMQKSVNLLHHSERVIISSDHGCSRLAVIGRQQTYSVDKDVKVENHGRTCVKSGKTKGQEYLGAIEFNDNLVFSNYNRFSIQGNPAGEVHGGATLEELLVPVIVLSRQPLEEKMDIELLTHKINVKAGKKAEIRVKVNRAVDTMIVVFGDIRTQGKFEGMQCLFEVDLPKGIHKGKIISEITVEIIKGFSDNFDI